MIAHYFQNILQNLKFILNIFLTLLVFYTIFTSTGNLSDLIGYLTYFLINPLSQFSVVGIQAFLEDCVPTKHTLCALIALSSSLLSHSVVHLDLVLLTIKKFQSTLVLIPHTRPKFKCVTAAKTTSQNITKWNKRKLYRR